MSQTRVDHPLLGPGGGSLRAARQALLGVAGRRAVLLGERWLAAAYPRPAPVDEDERLVATLLAPPPLEQAQASLEYWRERRRRLPAYRVRARREAEACIVRAEADVRAARRARYGPTLVEQLSAALGLQARLAVLRRAVRVAAVATLVLAVALVLLCAALWAQVEPVLRQIATG